MRSAKKESSSATEQSSSSVTTTTARSASGRGKPAEAERISPSAPDSSGCSNAQPAVPSMVTLSRTELANASGSSPVAHSKTPPWNAPPSPPGMHWLAVNWTLPVPVSVVTMAMRSDSTAFQSGIPSPSRSGGDARSRTSAGICVDRFACSCAIDPESSMTKRRSTAVTPPPPIDTDWPKPISGPMGVPFRSKHPVAKTATRTHVDTESMELLRMFASL